MDDTDPIEELHEIRRKLIAQAGGTLNDYIQQVMERQKRNPKGLVDFSKPKTVDDPPRRKPAKTIAEAVARKPGRHRKAVAR